VGGGGGGVLGFQFHGGKKKKSSAGIFKQSLGARNRVGIGLSYRPVRLHSLASFVPWNRFWGSLKVQKFGLYFVFVSFKQKICVQMLSDSATAILL
jgi:hypothetical protein